MIIVKNCETVLVDMGNGFYKAVTVYAEGADIPPGPGDPTKRSYTLSDKSRLNKKLTLYLNALETGKWSTGANYDKDKAFNEVVVRMVELGDGISVKNRDRAVRLLERM